MAFRRTVTDGSGIAPDRSASGGPRGLSPRSTGSHRSRRAYRRGRRASLRACGSARVSWVSRLARLGPGQAGRGRRRPQQGRKLAQFPGVVRLELPDGRVQGLLVGGDELLLIAGLVPVVDA